VLLASTAGCGALEFPEGVLSDASYDRGTESLDAPELRDAVRFDTSRFDIGRFDTGRDTGVDAGRDTGMDVGFDTGRDTGIDVGFDTGRDTGIDVGFDTGRDTGIDVGFDTGRDTGVDVGFDTGRDAGADVGVDTPCPSGQTRCGDRCVSLNSNESHCGACDQRCEAGPGATANCIFGTCRITCLSGRGDCNSNPADGCETTLSDNPMHCGACGDACAAPNATTTCAAGACQITACATGFTDCDMRADTGCEAELASSNTHCGACGTPCRTTVTCLTDPDCGGTRCFFGVCSGQARACTAGMCVLCGAPDAPCCASERCAPGLVCAPEDGGVGRCVPAP